MRGSKTQHGWSISTSFLNSFNEGWIGGTNFEFIASLGSASQTSTQRTPLFFLLTTSSFLRILPLDRQCAWSLSTFSLSLLGGSPSKRTVPLIVPQPCWAL